MKGTLGSPGGQFACLDKALRKNSLKSESNANILRNTVDQIYFIWIS